MRLSGKILGKDTSNKVLQVVSLNSSKHKAKPSKNCKSNLQCHHCGKKGHIKKNCFSFKRSLENKDKEKQAQVANAKTGRSIAFMLRKGKVIQVTLMYPSYWTRELQATL